MTGTLRIEALKTEKVRVRLRASKCCPASLDKAKIPVQMAKQRMLKRADLAKMISETWMLPKVKRFPALISNVRTGRPNRSNSLTEPSREVHRLSFHLKPLGLSIVQGTKQS